MGAPEAGTLWPGLVLGCLLIANGRPLPHRDDLFWVGTARGLLEQGDLVNPATQAFLSYFHTAWVSLYPPVYFYALAAWIRALGVSAVSLLAMHWLLTFGSLLSFGRALDILRVPAVVRGLSGLMLVWQLADSLRPEPLAYLLGFSGLAAWLTGRSAVPRALGVLLLGLSVATYPSTLTLLPFALLFGELRPRESAPFSLWRDVAPGLAASGLLLLVLVRFRLGEFLRVLLENRALEAASPWSAPAAFVTSITQYWEWLLTLPFYALFVAAVAWALPLPRPGAPAPLPARRFILATAGLLALSILLYAERTPLAVGKIFVFAADLVMLYSVLGSWAKPALPAIGFAWLVLAHAHPLLALMEERGVDAENVARVARELEMQSGPLYIDGAVARYVYDYRTPPNARSFFFGTPPPAGYPDDPHHPLSLRWKHPGDTWAASESTLIWVADALQPPPQRAAFLGHTFGSVLKEPLRLVVIE